jgi:MATE family multidrug resistance protein
MSQALGARRPLRATRYLGLACNLGLVFCLVTVFMGFIFRQEIMWLIQVPENIVDLSVRLWLFFLFGVPAQYAISLGASAFRAYKKVTMPLYTGMVICVLNFFLNIGLGLGRWGFPGLGPDGLAIGALISMYSGAAFIFFMLIRQGYFKRAAFAPLRWQKKAVGYLIKVALPAGGNQLSWQLGYLVLLGIVGALPSGSVHALAGMAAGMRIESLLFLPAIAFGMTGTILVGYCLGNGNPVEARRVGLKIIAIGCLSMTLVALAIWPFVKEISAFMAPSLDVQPEVISYLLFNLLATPFTVGSTILGGLLTGAGASIYPFIIYGCTTWLLRLPLAWWLGHVALGDAAGVYASQAISQVVMCCVILLVFIRCDWARFSMYGAKTSRPVPGLPRSAG